MEIYFGHKDFKSHKPVVTLGMFDGVHRGHRALLDSLISKAKKLGSESVVMTLNPHPRILLSRSDSSLRFLTSLEEKIELLEEAGIDKLVVIPFSRKLSRMPACDFIKKYLVDIIGVEHLIMGFDHHFGYRGYGNAVTVTECAANYGFSVDRQEPLKEGSEIISSTTIRELIFDGSLSKANRLLGYPYRLKGKVVEGKKIGRMLGFPTANITLTDELVPKAGVYAVTVECLNNQYQGVANIGYSPTFDDHQFTVEVHLLDFKKDIYGEQIRVNFVKRIRSEMKFSNINELSEQIHKDIDRAKNILSG